MLADQASEHTSGCRRCANVHDEAAGLGKAKDGGARPLT